MRLSLPAAPRLTLPRAVAVLVLSLLTSAAPSIAFAQDSWSIVPPVPHLVATRTDSPLRVDGRLDEDAWARAQPVGDFTQRAPREGIGATTPTEVRVLYDGDALWIGARMSSPDRASIQRPIGRRDNVREMEHFIVSLDTYRDSRTAYTFAVSASGVRADWYHPRDDEQARELSYAPVWEAAAQVSDSG